MSDDASGRRWLVILLGLFAAIGLGFAFPYVVRGAADWSGGLAWERNVILAIPRPLPPPLDTLLIVVAWLSRNRSLAPVVLGLAIWLWVAKGRRDLAARLVVVQAGSYLLSFVLKESFDRARPELIEWRGPHASSAYPSGHAIALSVLLTLGLILRRERGITWPLVLAVIISVGILYSRVYLGAHWPTDVIGGTMVGLVWLVATSLAFATRPRQVARLSESHAVRRDVTSRR